ncbi:uncharacterized protein BO66DRAFT_152679 [Aspergillus aculeatinus CBS 121060]|uniref:Uncharacterized protein n=1 Tax=Aspergillus aculeatinus CBS 121060 TaxID=1448322 RepID=A0ACD1H251_9EURO|nr:hypothetical protein BO66DRAFT_152679 [Aspergillus aculeatinus CBS 121060]RAH67505.1 hypothetical protein BO66DRAFT_152679 [Aspergillus aculeatinus CBS 121060]
MRFGQNIQPNQKRHAIHATAVYTGCISEVMVFSGYVGERTTTTGHGIQNRPLDRNLTIALYSCKTRCCSCLENIQRLRGK